MKQLEFAFMKLYPKPDLDHWEKAYKAIEEFQESLRQQMRALNKLDDVLEKK